MFDRIGISTRMLLLLSPPFFVLAYAVFTAEDGRSPLVVLGTGLSFLISIAISVWHVRSLVEERRAGRETAQALDALDALEANEDIALVLMDIMMPVMDGIEATRRIRANPKHADLPIFALTAKSEKEDREACFAASANAYMAKPIDNDRLMSCLYDALNPEAA